MLITSKRDESLSVIADRLSSAPVPSAEILSAILNHARRGDGALQGRVAAHIRSLIEVGAWTEAALALAEICCPHWHLSRLMYDSGEWHCTLSSQRDLPQWLDQTIETRAEELSCALLRAVVEAARNEEENADRPAVRPRLQPAPENLILCEDFF
jgi:hypothetical protein